MFSGSELLSEPTFQVTLALALAVYAILLSTWFNLRRRALRRRADEEAKRAAINLRDSIRRDYGEITLKLTVPPTKEKPSERIALLSNELDLPSPRPTRIQPAQPQPKPISPRACGGDIPQIHPTIVLPSPQPDESVWKKIGVTFVVTVITVLTTLLLTSALAPLLSKGEVAPTS